MKAFPIVLVACLFLAVGPAEAADPWTKTEIIGEAVALALIAADWGTTLDIADNPDEYREVNPILGDHPSRGKVNLFIGASMIAHPIIAHFLPSKWRRAWIFSTIAVEGYCVANNYGIGLKMRF